MKWRKKRKVIRHYDESAGVYDTLYSEEQISKIKSALSLIEIRDSDIILDAGCGTGLLFNQIGRHVHLLVGLDISAEILKLAKRRCKDLSGASSIFLVCADADYMPFPDGVFDKVFAVTLLQNVPDVNTTLREIMRVSKEKSMIVNTGLKKTFSLDEFSRILSEACLEFSMVEKDDRIKDHIAICQKG